MARELVYRPGRHARLRERAYLVRGFRITVLLQLFRKLVACRSELIERQFEQPVDLVRRFSSFGHGNERSMPRAIWSGSIAFGLVNVPVRLYSAVQEHKLRFHLVHEKDSSPIGYQKICKKEDKPISDEEIVKAFEYTKGEYVFLDDDDFEAAKAEGYKSIEIVDFVPYHEIDPIFFAHTYYVGPGRGAEKTYALLVKAMEESDLAGIAKYVMRDRQSLGALRIR